MSAEVYLRSYVIAITVHQDRKVHLDRKQLDHLQELPPLNKVSHLDYPLKTVSHHLEGPHNKIRHHLAWHINPVRNHLARPHDKIRHHLAQHLNPVRNLLVRLVVQIEQKDLQR